MGRVKTVSIAVGILGLLTSLWPQGALAAGISASGGGKYATGQQFTITVRASGTTFDSLQGTISVSGPVQIVSFSGGGATWLPGKAPGNGNQFVGIVNPTSSLTVATIKLKGTKEGSGSVTVSGVKLARSGAYVGSDAGGTSFTIVRAPTPPGTISVKSATHPDQGQAYESTKVELSWDKPAGVTGFSYAFNQEAETVPGTTVTSGDTSATYNDVTIGTHYFHIRALNADGWGPTTHFKVTVKEPDPKVDESLNAPFITSVERGVTFATDVENGTFTGILVKGTGGLADFQVKLAISPPERIPTEAVLSTTPNADGSWQILIDKPVPAGFYSLTAQGQKDKILTPLSPAVKFEVSVADGGKVKVITTADSPENIKAKPGLEILGWQFKEARQGYFVLALLALSIASVALNCFLLLKLRRKTL